VWWPDRPESVYPLLSGSPIVTVMQCGDDIAEALRPYSFRCKFFDTLLIDLSQPVDVLWGQIHSTTRSNINQAKRLECQILVNENKDEALQLINEFIIWRKYRAPLSTSEWRRILSHGDVFFVRHEGKIIAAQVNLVDHSHRARLLLAATVGRNIAQFQRVSGHLNRLLLWFVINHYKTAGVRWYDFGGVILDKNSSLYSISQYKLSFGGHVVRENTLRLAGNSAIRWTLRGIFGARLAWRSAVPYLLKGSRFHFEGTPRPHA
jgi:hypothetical protein